MSELRGSSSKTTTPVTVCKRSGVIVLDDGRHCTDNTEDTVDKKRFIRYTVKPRGELAGRVGDRAHTGLSGIVIFWPEGPYYLMSY